MKKYKFFIGCIFSCLLCALVYGVYTTHNMTGTNSVNMVSEIEEGNEQELEILPVEQDETQLSQRYDKINNVQDFSKKTEKDETMKKEFELPVVEVVEFENEDILTTSVETPIVPPGE